MNNSIILSLLIVACISFKPFFGLKRFGSFPPTPSAVSTQTVSRDDKEDAKCFRTIYEAYQIAIHIPDNFDNIQELINNLKRLTVLIEPSFKCLNFTGEEMINTVERFTTNHFTVTPNNCIIDHLTQAYAKLTEIYEDISNRDAKKLEKDISDLIAIIQDIENCF